MDPPWKAMTCARGWRTSCCGPVPVSLSAAFAKLRQLFADACTKPAIVEEGLVFIQAAETAATAQNFNEAVTQIDLFVQLIARNMGHFIALHQAYELVDVAIIDIKRTFGDPAQIITEAFAFSCKFQEVNYATDSPLFLPARPIESGAEVTGETMKSAIRSYRVPQEEEASLLSLVDQLVGLASRASADLERPEDQGTFISTVDEFHGTLKSLECSAITTSQVNYQLGMIVFGFPVVLCVTPVSWVIQGAIVLGLAGCGSGKSKQSTPKAVAAETAIYDAAIDKAISRVAAVKIAKDRKSELDQAALNTLIKRLQKEKDGFAGSVNMRNRLAEIISTLRKCKQK